MKLAIPLGPPEAPVEWRLSACRMPKPCQRFGWGVVDARGLRANCTGSTRRRANKIINALGDFRLWYVRIFGVEFGLGRRPLRRAQ